MNLLGTCGLYFRLLLYIVLELWFTRHLTSALITKTVQRLAGRNLISTLILNAGAVMKLVAALCLLAFAAVASGEVNGTVETSSQEISSMPAAAFVYNPLLTNDVDVSCEL